MGWFGRRKGGDDPAWSPPTEGRCGCARHLDEGLLEAEVPYAPGAGIPDDEPPMSVGELIDSEALGCEPLGADERMLDDGTGPYHWNVWFGDETRGSYADDAELELDAAVQKQAGVERVAWLDREVMYLGAPTLCRSGVLAAAALGLLEPGVRR